MSFEKKINGSTSGDNSFEAFMNLESLLLNAANKKDYGENLKFVLNFYGDDFEEEKLKTQLELFHHCFDKNDLEFQDILSHFQYMENEIQV